MEIGVPTAMVRTSEQMEEERASELSQIVVVVDVVVNLYRLPSLQMAFLCHQFRHVKTAAIRPRTPPQAPSGP